MLAALRTANEAVNRCTGPPLALQQDAPVTSLRAASDLVAVRRVSGDLIRVTCRPYAVLLLKYQALRASAHLLISVLLWPRLAGSWQNTSVLLLGYLKLSTSPYANDKIRLA